MTGTPWNLEHPNLIRGSVFVTFRLVDSVTPSDLLRLHTEQESWLLRNAQRGISPSQYRRSANKRFLGRLDDLLDAPGRVDWLMRPGIADIVRASLLRYDGVYYRIGAYCILHNHVHILIHLPEPITLDPHRAWLGEQARIPEPLDRFLAFWTLGTTPRINRVLQRSGPVWHPATYLQPIHDHDELNRLVDYITFNPLKAGLAARPHEWPWSSAHDRYHRDGRESGWLFADPITTIVG